MTWLEIFARFNKYNTNEDALTAPVFVIPDKLVPAKAGSRNLHGYSPLRMLLLFITDNNTQNNHTSEEVNTPSRTEPDGGYPLPRV